MVVAAIIVLVAAFAIPAYNGYVERSRVSRVIGEIGVISLRLYQWQLNTQRFPATLTEAGIDATDPWGRSYQYMPVDGTHHSQLRKDTTSTRSTLTSIFTASDPTARPESR